MAEFLGSSDAFMWSIESDPRLRSTIVTLLLLDNSPDWNMVVDRFDRMSRTVPRFRQRVVQSLPAMPPRWEFDPDFDLGFHVRRVTAPSPGTLATCLEMARLAAMADFDRARPLWEATLIDGLSGGGAALLCRLHHALTDGIGAVGVATMLFDRASEEPGPMPPVPTTRPTGLLDLIRDAVSYPAGLTGSAVTGAISEMRKVADKMRDPVRTVATACSIASSVVRTARPVGRPGSPIMRHRNLVRRVGIHEVSKAELHRAGEVAGGSLNDAFIAAVAAGLRRYHEKHDATVSDLMMSMPISIRAPDDPMGGNRATLMRFEVPAAISDPAALIRAIHARTSRARTERSLSYTDQIAGALNLMPRWYVSSALRHVDFVASDVPGFPMRVFLGGAPVRMQYAFSPTIGAAVNVTLLSYVDTCAIGINVDCGAIPDYDLFFDCLVAGFDEVLVLARRGRCEATNEEEDLL